MAASSQDHQPLNAETDAALIINFCYILLKPSVKLLIKHVFVIIKIALICHLKILLGYFIGNLTSSRCNWHVITWIAPLHIQ